MALYPDSLYDFPNVSAYDSDLREALAMLRGLTNKMRDFEVVNNITNAGAWDITKQYKPWTIVSDNNIGYISVRPVPAGIEITNTDYWALVADYDILITNLSERISALESTVNTLTTATLPALDKKIMGRIADKKFIFLGDSYGIDFADNWITYFCSYMGLTSEQYSNLCVSGASAVAGDYLQSLQSYSGDRDSITDIIICGGANDFGYSSAGYTLTDVSNALKNLITYINSNFKNAKICVGMIGNRNNDETIGTLGTYLDILSAYIEGATGARYLTDVDLILKMAASRHAMLPDNVHPNQGGMQYLGLGIKNAYCGGDMGIFTPPALLDVTGIFNNQLIMIQDRTNGTIFSQNLIVEGFTTGLSPAWAEIGTIGGVWFNGEVIKDVDLSVSQDNGNSWIEIHGAIKFSKNKVYVMAANFNGGSWATFNPTNIAVRPFTVSFDLRFIVAAQ